MMNFNALGGFRTDTCDLRSAFNEVDAVISLPLAASEERE